MEKEFESGAIVWAKMKGFPPWPAKIMQSSDKMEGIPAGRYSVLFFGTRETAIMKKCDLFDYTEHRAEYEVDRRAKGFNEALEEAREAIGDYRPKDQSMIMDNGSPLSGCKGGNRCRRKSTNRSESSENLLENLLASPTTSSPMKRTPSHSPIKDLTESRNERRRLESFTSISGRRKTNSFSQSFDLDLNEDPMLPILSDGVFNNILDGIGADIDQASRPTVKSAVRSTKSIIGDYISSGKLREHFSSASSSGRTRLFSNTSDGFDDFFASSPLFSPTDPLSSLPFTDILSICEDRPTTGFDEQNFESQQQSQHQMFCSNCGCQCTLYGPKWRCTSMSCLKWNGIYDPPISCANNTQLKETQEDVKTDLITLNASPSAELRDNTFGSVQNPSASNVASDCLTHDSFSSIFGQTSGRSITKVERQPAQVPGYSHAVVQHNTIPTEVHSFSSQNHTEHNQNVPSRRTGSGRPKFYKVEKTPLVAEDGCRHCFHCNGQVRPQMCGGNRHRWRCVDKKCRKWYGWVRSHEEIPKDLGKKGRWKDLITIRRKSPSFSEADGEQGDLASKTTKKNAKQSGNRARSSGVVQLRSCMERRVRWWTNEKREIGLSPEREFPSYPLDAAAVCITVSKSMISAASTRADEPGTVNGSLDLLLDALFSSFAPLLALTKQVPDVLDQETEKRIWEACAVHTPRFA